MKKASAPSILVAVVMFAVAVMAEAQQTAKVPRLGFLSGGSSRTGGPNLTAFWQGLRELGYVEGKNILIEYGLAGKLDRLPVVAAQLVGLKVDIIVAGGGTEPAQLPRKRPRQSP